MSLTTFLLGAGKSSVKKKVIDNDLDALFYSRTKPDPTEFYPATTQRENKKRGVDAHAREPGSKRTKTADAVSSSLSPAGEHKKSRRSRVRIDPESGIVAPRSKHRRSVPSDDSGAESEDEDKDDPSLLVHETLKKEKLNKVASKRAKYVPTDESKETRDARTIFIGNLAPDVALKRPLKKQLHRHVLGHIPTAKIESVRFRSVAFQTPTSKLPETDEDMKKKEHRQHERDRASSWRDAHVADESKANEKNFLTPSQKKKIAFINGNIHSDAGAVHAYMVFAYPTPRPRSSDLPHLPLMDPFEATRLAVEKCNGTMFLNRMLRVDAVGKHSTTDRSSEGTHIGDPKLAVFVGNLDFASNEEDLRLFFEGIVSTERGPCDAAGTHDGDTPTHWVTSVRIIRDKDTQLGKGFAYVQFSDRTCVDEVLALESDKLKFAKRKLRVQRCKLMPNATKPAKQEHVSSPETPMRNPGSIHVPPIPKGDPSLGEKLVQLSKEERKRAKAVDADRVARRMAKKKARLALAKQGVPHKQRERVRKTDTAKQAGPPKKTSKGRVRSEKSIAKKNVKK